MEAKGEVGSARAGGERHLIPWPALLAVALGGAAAYGAVVWMYGRERPGYVYFDNGLAQAVSVRIDGQARGGVEPGQHLRVAFRAGEYDVAIFAGSSRLEARIVRLEVSDGYMGWTEDYVYNVQARNRYRRRTIQYGGGPFGWGGSKPDLIEGETFFPADADFVLPEGGPPERVEKGEFEPALGGIFRTVLERVER